MDTEAGKTDHELVQKFLNGHQQSYFELVDRYESKIFNTALYLSQDSKDAEAVLQDVFIALESRLREDSGQTALFPWLVSYTVDRAVERLIASDPAERRSAERLSDAEPAAGDEELRAIIRNAAESLPSEARYVFVLRDIHGIALNDIAAILDMTIFEVRCALRRARRCFAENLSGYPARAAGNSH